SMAAAVSRQIPSTNADASCIYSRAIQAASREVVRLSMTKAGVGALGVVLLAVLIFLVVSSWSRQPAAAKPSVQPINFPHNTHVQTYKIDCQYCHADAADDGLVHRLPSRAERDAPGPRAAGLHRVPPLMLGEQSMTCRRFAVGGVGRGYEGGVSPSRTIKAGAAPSPR